MSVPLIAKQPCAALTTEMQRFRIIQTLKSCIEYFEVFMTTEKRTSKMTMVAFGFANWLECEGMRIKTRTCAFVRFAFAKKIQFFLLKTTLDALSCHFEHHLHTNQVSLR